MEHDRLPLVEIAITLAGIALLAAIFVAVDPLRDSAAAAVRGDHDEVRDQIDRLGIGGSIARPLLDRWFGEERFERAERSIERGGATLLLAMRLIPILPFSIVSYAAGAARVPLRRFLWTTVVGYLPITALSVSFGTRLEGLSLTDPLVLGSALALLALLGAGHWVMRRQASRSSA